MEIGSLVEVLNEGVVSAVKGTGYGLFNATSEGMKSIKNRDVDVYDHKLYDNHKINRGIGKGLGYVTTTLGGLIDGVGGGIKGFHGGLMYDDYKTPVKELTSYRRRLARDQAKEWKKELDRTVKNKGYEPEFDKEEQSVKKFLDKNPAKLKNIPRAIVGGAQGLIDGGLRGAATGTYIIDRHLAKDKNPLIKYNPVRPVAAGIGGLIGAVGGGLSGGAIGAYSGIKGDYRKALDVHDKSFDKMEKFYNDRLKYAEGRR